MTAPEKMNVAQPGASVGWCREIKLEVRCDVDSHTTLTDLDQVLIAEGDDLHIDRKCRNRFFENGEGPGEEPSVAELVVVRHRSELVVAESQRSLTALVDQERALAVRRSSDTPTGLATMKLLEPFGDAGRRKK